MTAFFITGTSGSGKTTLMNVLKEQLSSKDFLVYDFDEVGVPEGADKEWRLQTTKYWLQQAKVNYLQKKVTVICGVSVPSEVVELSRPYNFSIYFGFIKIDDDVIIKRLHQRKWSKQLIKDNIKWAHHLEKDVIHQNNHCIVNGLLNPKELAIQFKEWILKRKN